jgi:hypothetical protein
MCSYRGLDLFLLLDFKLMCSYLMPCLIALGGGIAIVFIILQLNGTNLI